VVGGGGQLRLQCGDDPPVLGGHLGCVGLVGSTDNEENPWSEAEWKTVVPAMPAHE
jgi:hypothetical protein